MAIATLYKGDQRVAAETEQDVRRLFREGYTLEQAPPRPQAPKPGDQGTYQEHVNYAFNNPEYQESQRRVQEARDTLSGLTEKEPGYYDRKAQQFEEADPALQKLLGERGDLVGQYSQGGIQARNRYKNIFDPAKRRALVSQAVANTVGNLSKVGGLVEQQRGFAGQRAQTALDTLLAQTGAAETLLESETQGRDELRDILLGSAEAEFGKQYTPVSDDEWDDIEKKAQIDKKYTTRSSEAPDTPTLWDQLKEDVENGMPREVALEMYPEFNTDQFDSIYKAGSGEGLTLDGVRVALGLEGSGDTVETAPPKNQWWDFLDWFKE